MVKKFCIRTHFFAQLRNRTKVILTNSLTRSLLRADPLVKSKQAIIRPLLGHSKPPFCAGRVGRGPGADFLLKLCTVWAISSRRRRTRVLRKTIAQQCVWVGQTKETAPH